MTEGTVNISRALWHDDAFANDPFSEREAWVWMIAEAGWKARTRRVGRATVSLDRGQLAGSVRFFAEAWGWSASAVHRYLDKLRSRGMIRVDAGTLASVVTICKYEEYQGGKQKRGTPPEHSRNTQRNARGTVGGTLTEHVTSGSNKVSTDRSGDPGTLAGQEAEHSVSVSRNKRESTESKGKKEGGGRRAPAPAREASLGNGDDPPRLDPGAGPPVSLPPEKPKAPPPHPAPTPAPADLTFRERLLAAMGADPVSGMVGPRGRPLGSPADMVLAGRWRAAGLTEADVLAEVADVMAGKRDGPPRSFAYFDPAMERLATLKATPPPAPFTPPSHSDPGAPHAGRSTAAPYRHPLRAAAKREHLRSVVLAAAAGTVAGTVRASGSAGDAGEGDPRPVLDGRGHV